MNDCHIVDGETIHCQKCGEDIGEWIAVGATPSQPPNCGSMIVEVLLPVGMSFDEDHNVCRLSKNARKRMAQGLPARRIRADQMPVPRGRIATDFRSITNFLEKAFREPPFNEQGYEGPVLDQDQRHDTIVDYRETEPLPARIECMNPQCLHRNVVTLDTARTDA